MKRPMMLWGILFVLGVLIGRMHIIIVIVSLCILLTCNYICKIIRKKDDTLVISLGVVFFLVGCACMKYSSYKLELCIQLDNQECEFIGNVIAKEERANQFNMIVSGRFLQDTKLTPKVCIVAEQENDIELGEVVWIKGNVKRFSKATNYGGFDEETYRLGNGIYCKMEKTKLIAVKRKPFAICLWLEHLRQKIHAIFYACFDEARASVACAMVLGEKQMLEENIKELYQRNGIAHVIAISGLHIAMIGGALYKLLKRLSGRLGLSAFLGSVFIILYGTMTGLAGSTVRAMIMLILLFGADVFGRKYDILSAVAFALLVMLFEKPFSLTQPGFLLSYGAVLGIAWVKPVLSDLFSNNNVCIEGLLVSLSVNVMTLPIMLYFYYKIPMWSILLNLVVVPCMTFLLAGLLACAFLGNFWLSGAVGVSRLCNIIFYLYEVLCNQCERLPLHTICTGRPAFIYIEIYYGLLCIYLVYSYMFANSKRVKWFITIMWCMLITVLFLCTVKRDTLQICMMDVGQGDGFYLALPHNIDILIDGGSSSKKKPGKNVIVPSVQYFGAETLEYVFVTHSDQDHDNGIVEMISENQIEVRHLVLPAIGNPDDSYLQLVELAKQKKIDIIYMKRGDCLKTQDVQIQCLSPVGGSQTDKNNGSLCLLLNYNQFDMLFTGDMEKEAENELLQTVSTQKNEIEVLKIAHHGSDTSSGEAFINWVAPEISFVSVGPNRYGHPTDTVLKRLENSRIYRTDQNGAVLLSTDGNEIWIDTCKK